MEGQGRRRDADLHLHSLLYLAPTARPTIPSCSSNMALMNNICVHAHSFLAAVELLEPKCSPSTQLLDPRDQLIAYFVLSLALLLAPSAGLLTHQAFSKLSTYCSMAESMFDYFALEHSGPAMDFLYIPVVTACTTQPHCMHDSAHVAKHRDWILTE